MQARRKWQAHGPWLRRAYLACALLAGVCFFSFVMATAIWQFFDIPERPPDPTFIEFLVTIALTGIRAVIVLFVVKLVLALVWLHRAWSFFPVEHRLLESGKPVTPGTTVAYLFVPFYNLYWMFVVTRGLCAVFERLGRAYALRSMAPRDLALGWGVVQFIPFFNLMVSPFLFFAFMRSVERLQGELLPLLQGHDISTALEPRAE